jgi:hypothetical protein
MLAVAVLLLIGIVHLPIQFMSEQLWEDPISFRKPILFGISTGVTLGSLLMLLDELRPRRLDTWLRAVLCSTLTLEVILITIQPWRGEGSHFNRSGPLNATIEFAMLVLILTAVLIIAYLTLRSAFPGAFRPIPVARVAGHRWGMLFLLVSCALGIWITIEGSAQLARGGDPGLMGEQGVLKFPHGATLHAIQTLVIWAWICDWIGSRYAWHSVTWLAASHLLLLIYSMRQTLLGRGRWEMDAVGSGLLTGIALTGLLSIGLALWSQKLGSPRGGEDAAVR